MALPQISLDPAQPISGDPVTPRKPIPSSAREFGRLPDTRNLLPGDIILFSRISPRLTHRAIQQVQTAYGFGRADADWHHAGIYVGQETVCESTFSGVGFNTMLDRLQTYRLRARRLPGISDMERFDIAIQAMSNLRRSYGFSELFNLMYGSFKFGANRLVKRDFRLICSEVCADAYGVVGITIHSQARRRATMPADISLSNRFEDVQMQWCPIAEEQS